MVGAPVREWVRRSFRRVLPVLVAALIAAGCGSAPSRSAAASAEPGGGGTSTPPPSGTAGVVFDYVTLDADPSDPNPINGGVAPSGTNRVGFVRARADSGNNAPRPVSAILVLLGGHTLGGGEFLYLAPELINLADGDLEVWLEDRRCHFLEDDRGLDRAKEIRDPKVAHDYYFGGQPIDGQVFAGFLPGRGRATDFMSEWGLDLELRDIRRILSLVPEAGRRTNLFLGGHSRGVAFAQAYASHLFADGHLGSDDLAGLVLIDGGPKGGGPTSEQEYLDWIRWIRTGVVARYATFPPVVTPFYTLIPILAMAAADDFANPSDPSLGPGGIWPYRGAADLVFRALFLGKNITLTNEAVFGVFVDKQFAAIEILTGNLGTLDGGPVQHLVKRDIPSSEETTYIWVRGSQTVPPEPGDIQALIHTFFAGPTPALEPYYPARVDLDLATAEDAMFRTEGTWRDAYFVQRNDRVDAPVYALATALLSASPDYQNYRDSLAPVRGGNAPRDVTGFHLLAIPEWDHLDPIMARPEMNPFYPDLWAWLQETASGSVQIPAIP